ncbi:MAG: bifunctional acetaldehyde-CoA/alcohol dehydrogenase [Intestinibacter sp.]|uniref:bifunctional acetaldehyde-CoA/alcohol dehydrogenase n=1 Tax=Intestinibacter sp. TaxID=1965304 RepID=UPI0025C516ED|nr:bifunctional acetaldehyde-CoA/alcohol dehydrogenase [Intestinibacter sp.]MCI6738479.1 bifunctional acetaldehyde-CoA/alcohol dehydrogenase [Intestinibacter sp.]
MIVKDINTLQQKMAEVRAAQQEYATYTQDQVDEIFFQVAMAANQARIPLAKMAAEETGIGVAEDKVIKNHFASEYIYNKYKDAKTCGVIDKDDAFGITKIAEPLGVLAGIIPTTNPTSTAIFKCLIALKTRNAIVFSPHPRAKKSTIAAVKLCLDAAVKAGAPENIIGWIDEPSIELSAEIMKQADTILATGGPGMVKAAYSSGKPALGVGSGNVPIILDKSCDIKVAVSSVIHSKTFDNGTICASEQAVIVDASIYNEVQKEFVARNAYIAKGNELTKLKKVVLGPNGTMNAKLVGRPAVEVAREAGFEVPADTKLIIGEATSTDISEPLSHEKLFPVLSMYKSKDFDDAVQKADQLVQGGGIGHTAGIYIDVVNNREKLDKFQNKMKACRILVNTPSAFGGIGDVYNFKLEPSLTLGCGSWGNNSFSGQVGPFQLLNVKTVAERRENMLWFRTPVKTYIKKGCLGVAIKELGPEYYDFKKAFIVTDSFLYENGYTKPVTDQLDAMGIQHATFSEVAPDPTLKIAQKGADQLRAFEPDVIIAIGGGSPMDAAKIMWVMYEHPECDFLDLAMRFMDIRKRVYQFPKMGNKAKFVAIPTSSGTGSEVTPFAVITDDETGQKYPLADYELMPTMAIVDADMMMNQPKGLTAASGIDALTHSLEAYAAMLQTEFTDGLAMQATKSIFEYLPRAYENGANDPKAREKMAHASTMAGMAFANAFLGVCHSLAHKLGAYHHIPHGVANALLINLVLEFNASTAPRKMGTFPQYEYPNMIARYAELAEFVGCKGKTDEEKFEALQQKIRDLKKAVGIPETIKEFGIDEREFLANLDQMVEDAFDDQCTGANPRYPLFDEIKEMYLKAYYGEAEYAELIGENEEDDEEFVS